MDRTITKAVSLGVLPLVVSVLAYLAARELLFWPRLGAKLCAVAAWLFVVGFGYELCRRFFEAGGRKCQPREVGWFLARLALLYALSALSMVTSYLLAAELFASRWTNPWLCYLSAISGGSLCFVIFIWIFFTTKDPHRGGRRVLEGDRLKREADRLDRELKGAKDAPVFFAGHWLPFEKAVDHFLVMGATNTGKTLVQRMLMQSALRTIGLGLDQRAVVFNAKQDVLSILAGMNLKCLVITLDPFDVRGYAWDMAADIRNRLDAQTLAENLVPIDEHATQKFFDEAVRSLYEEVVVTFQKTAPGDWTFRDVILAMRDRELLTRVLKRTKAGRGLLKLCFANEETAQNIVATINNRTKAYCSIASCWQRAKDAGRTISLTGWLTQESVLVLGNSHTARPAIQAVNQVLFTRLAELILSQKGSTTRRNWMFLDEVRQAGRLEKLTSLMVEGRSRGAAVVLGFQDMEGMMHVHTPHLAKELTGQAHNVCITKLINPETAELASRMFGEYEAIEKDESVTKSQGGGRSRTVSVKLVRRQAVMASEFMNIPMPSQKGGLTFYALTSGRLRAYHETMPGEVVASMLSPANSDPAKGGVSDSEPVPDDWLEIRPWDKADYARLKMSAPRGLSAKKQPKNKPSKKPSQKPAQQPTKPCEQRRQRDKLRLIEGGKKRAKSGSSNG